MGVFERAPGRADTGHELVTFVQDPATGLRAIIAIYSTRLGPALGGTRFFPYPDEEAAVSDVLRLSRAMAYKAAAAGLPLGGGKAVILGDPATQRSEALLEAYGRAVEALGGRYWTACDVGTTVADMDVVARASRYVTGRSPAAGGAGDSGVLTAFGVFQAMRAAAEHRWGEPSLAGRRVGVEGVGKVGSQLVRHLVADGARVLVSDVRAPAVASLTAEFPDLESCDVTTLRTAELDVYSPCALGGSLSDELVPRLQAEVVCGGANNQLAHAGVEAALAEAGVLYTPDYVANAGGLVQVADEMGGFDFERARSRAAQIYQTTLEVFRRAAEQQVPPAVAADRMAEERMAAASGVQPL
jgi:valine dehydrogenase (NAD+)